MTETGPELHTPRDRVQIELTPARTLQRLAAVRALHGHPIALLGIIIVVVHTFRQKSCYPALPCLKAGANGRRVLVGDPWMGLSTVVTVGLSSSEISKHS